MKKSFLTPLAASVILFGTVAGASAQLFSDNFDSGVSDAANWNINLDTGNNAATFGFDYSTVGISSAPHSTGGTTIGVKMEANFTAGSGAAFGGVSISPTGKSFGTSYRLTFDFWSQYTGNASTVGGSGTTQLTGAGVGTSGTVAQTAKTAAPTSVYFGQTADGGNGTASQDYRAYSSAAVGGGTSGTGVGYTAASGVFAAGTGATAVDNANARYIPLGNNTVPAAQTAITATQLGVTPAGAPGFAWHSGEILKLGNTITYSIDGILIATVDSTLLTLSGSNIELFQSDINAGASTSGRTYSFGLFDNIVVTPEPSTWALGIMGAAGVLMARRRKSK